MNNHTLNLGQLVTVIHACSDFVAQLDTHLAGGILFLCCLVLVTIVIAHLTH
jgi:hypothetical protein